MSSIRRLCGGTGKRAVPREQTGDLSDQTTFAKIMLNATQIAKIWRRNAGTAIEENVQMAYV